MATKEFNCCHTVLKALQLAPVGCNYNDMFINAITQDWQSQTTVNIDVEGITINFSFFDCLYGRLWEVEVFASGSPLNFRIRVDADDAALQNALIYTAMFMIDYLLNSDGRFYWGGSWGSLKEICYRPENLTVEPGTDLSLWCDMIEGRDDW